MWKIINKSYFIYLMIIAVLLSSCAFTKPQTNNENGNQTQQSPNPPDITSKTTNNFEDLSDTEASIHFLDTGNSDCIIIRQNDITIIIDGADSGDSSMINSYLASVGTTSITAMINTHPDADHVGGLAKVMTEYPIERLFISNGDSSTKTYRTFIETAAQLGLSSEVPLENQRFQFGDGYLTFFNTKAIGSNNDVSLIILYEHNNHRFLFMGDAGIEQEKAYVDMLPDIDVLKVGHHGSRSSTSDQLLKATTPEHAVILVGSGNRYGHPHKEVLDRLSKFGINVYRTDIDGTIVATSSSTGITISKESSLRVRIKETTKDIIRSYQDYFIYEFILPKLSPKQRQLRLF